MPTQVFYEGRSQEFRSHRDSEKPEELCEPVFVLNSLHLTFTVFRIRFLYESLVLLSHASWSQESFCENKILFIYKTKYSGL